jgi:hypothetical protein
MKRLWVVCIAVLVAGAMADPLLRKKKTDDNEKKASSLFQRFMTVPVDVPMVQPPYPPYPPYMYDPSGYYYGYPPPGMMPPMAPPSQYYVDNGPPPPVYYGYPQMVPQQAPLTAKPQAMYAARPPPRVVQREAAQQENPTQAPVAVELQKQVVESPIKEHAKVETHEPNELKDELTKALNEASHQMDKVSNSALAPNAFDDLVWKPSSSPIETMSLSEDTVPIDNHILNWRDLVGLPAEK